MHTLSEVAMLHARIADLEVQVGRLTGRRSLSLKDTEDSVAWQLRLYRYAASYRPRAIGDAERMCLVLEKLSVLDLFEMARQTRDPFPWLELVRCLDAIAALGIDTASAEDSLMEVVDAMLRVQGIENVPLPNLLAMPGATTRAFAPISS